jgi:AraC-like DNA-binding protein
VVATTERLGGGADSSKERAVWRLRIVATMIPAHDLRVALQDGTWPGLLALLELEPRALPGATEAARRLGMTRQTFSEQFSARFQLTWRALRVGLRMEEALRLLAGNPDIPVRQVAKLVGYASTTAFHRAFHEHQMRTPRGQKTALRVRGLWTKGPSSQANRRPGGGRRTATNG